MIGQTFNRLTVLSQLPSTGEGARFLCRCLCGNETLALGKSLRSGHTTSCGCARESRRVSPAVKGMGHSDIGRWPRRSL